MTNASIKMKEVSLCFRGFNMAPNDVEVLVGLPASGILEIQSARSLAFSRSSIWTRLSWSGRL